MFSFFKRKKEGKKKQGGQKERGPPKEVGVAAQRDDGKFATTEGSPELLVEPRTSVQADHKVCDPSSPVESGQKTPLGTMGNDLSKPLSSLQTITDIPFIEIENVTARDSVPTAHVANEPDLKCEQTVTDKCLLASDRGELKFPDDMNSSSNVSAGSDSNHPETVAKVIALSELESPSLVKKISELENIKNAVGEDLKIFPECDSEFKIDAGRDEDPPTNETVEDKSVTDNVGTYNSDLARPGSVASCEEYSSGVIHDSQVTAAAPDPSSNEQSSEEMNKVTSYSPNFDNSGNLNSTEVFDKVKCNSEGNLYSLQKSSQNFDKIKIALELSRNVEAEESEESSEDEQSESDQSASDNIVKNDSGCWEERETSILSCDSENQANRVASILSVDIIDGKFKEKKHVKWADIDGKRNLTHEREGSVCSSESSSDEEKEEKTDEEDIEKEDDDEDEESEEEEESAEDNAAVNNVPILTDKNGQYNEIEPQPTSSEEEEEEEEEESEEEENGEGRTSAMNGICEITDKSGEDKKVETSSESEESDEESSAEESGNDDELKEEKTPIRIDIAEMQNRIADLQQDINVKASNIDRLQVELDAACNESEMVRRRFKRLEADLDLYKQTNKELTERINFSATQELVKAEVNSKKLEEAEKRIKELESELDKVRSELMSLQVSYKKLEADRDMEVQIIQKALEKALTDQEEMELKYEKEFENLRTLNSSREVQMLEDFEWKLREVQKACKKKLQENEAENEKKSLELANKLATAQVDLEQISHLKLCEIELNQLKQTSSEQRKNLRLTNRKLEELQVSEKILQEEVHSLRASLDKEKSHVATLQALHREELIDKDRKAKLKLESQISQLTSEWEERLRRETFKIKTEAERSFREEKNSAVESAKNLKDQEISQLKQNWDKKSQDFKKEIEEYKRKIKEMEDCHRTDFDKIQTNADRDILDLRRKMDKLDMNYQEKIEKIQEQHEKELTSLKEECERRVQQAEANLQLQVGNSRTTIELVKQQMQNEAQLKLENLEREYQKKLEQQWERLNEEKEMALEKLELSHKQSLELLYSEIEKIKKHSKAENEGKKKLQQLSQSHKTNPGQKRSGSVNEMTNPRNPASTRLDVAEVAEEIRIQGKEEVLQKSIEQLTKQLNAGKMEIEKLRQQLEARDNARQRNTPQPPPNPRRNRKPRSDVSCMYL